MNSRHIRTPKTAIYPLIAKEARVVPGEEVASGQGLYVFTMADQRDILIKAPWPARVGDHVLPVGAVLDRPVPFLTIQPLPEDEQESPEAHQPTKSDTERKRTTSAPTPHPDEPRQPASKRVTEPYKETRSAEKKSTPSKPTNPTKRGKWKAAGVSFLIPFCALVAVLVLVEFAFPYFFEEYILVRWMLVLMAYAGGAWIAAGPAYQIYSAKNFPATAATGLSGLLAVLILLPLNLSSGFFADLNFGDYFKPKAYGVVLTDLESLSNGRTPTPTAQQTRDFSEWLNE